MKFLLLLPLVFLTLVPKLVLASETSTNLYLKVIPGSLEIETRFNLNETIFKNQREYFLSGFIVINDRRGNDSEFSLTYHILELKSGNKFVESQEIPKNQKNFILNPNIKIPKEGILILTIF